MAIITRFPGRSAPEPAVPPPPAPAPVPRRARGATKEEDQRKAMLAKIHIALNILMKNEGWSEDTYRYGLLEKFGVNSAADLNNEQLHKTLLWLSSLGWQAKAGRHRRSAPRALMCDDLTHLGREELLAKIEAQLAEKGRVEGTDMPWGYAVAILKRQSGGVTKCLDQATPEQLRGVIAALWRDAKRKRRKVR
jgi:hypothetical protein